MTDIKKKFQTLKEKDPNLRMRDAADMLNLSEAELLATRCGVEVIRLDASKAKEILKEIPKLGKIMALSRNEYVVNELKGLYQKIHIGDSSIGYIAGEIELRISFDAWKMAFSSKDDLHGKTLRSFQFFTKNGEAIHKIYLQDQSNQKVYEEIIEKYKSEDQSPSQEIEYDENSPEEIPDEYINIEEFRKQWNEMKDVHELKGIAKKHKLTKIQTLRLAPEGMSEKIKNDSTRYLLEKAKEKEIPLMIFVGNKGIVQIFSGKIYNLKDHGPWFNVLDENFNLHLKEEGINQTWISKRPTKGGILHSVECFDKKGELLIQFFGEGGHGGPEPESWTKLSQKLSLRKN